MRNIFKIYLTICLTLVVIFAPVIVFGADNNEATKEVKLDNPLQSNIDSPAALIGLIIKAVLGVIGGLALVMAVWGGFQWLTSAGNTEKVKKGTQTMLWAIVGLILVFGSYVLVNAVFNFLQAGG